MKILFSALMIAALALYLINATDLVSVIGVLFFFLMSFPLIFAPTSKKPVARKDVFTNSEIKE